MHIYIYIDFNYLPGAELCGRSARTGRLRRPAAPHPQRVGGIGGVSLRQSRRRDAEFGSLGYSERHGGGEREGRSG